MKRARPVVPLDAARVDGWRLTRQHLGTAPLATHPAQVARDLVGVQAQVMSAASLAVALRTEGLRVDALPAALGERSVVRSWAMRGTLHVFAADDYPTIVGALRRRDMWRRPAWLRWFGMSEAAMEALIEAVGEILDDGRPRTRAELSDELGRRFGTEIGERVRSGWGSYLKPAADRGYLCQAGSDSPGVAFTRPDRWLASWRWEEPDVALPRVVGRYLATYGPASKDEVRRWWGSQPAMLRPAMAALAGGIVEVDVNGARGFARADDLDAIATTAPLAGSLRLLGPFDPLIVGAGLRDRLIPRAHLRRVSRTAGWISPVLLVNGIVAGVWTSQREAGVLAITVEPFKPLGRAERRQLETEAERVAARQGATARVELGIAFPSERLS